MAFHHVRGQHDKDEFMKEPFPEVALIKNPKSQRVTINHTCRNRVSIVIRTLAFRIFPGLKERPEGQKVAIQKDRFNASIRCLIHIVPITGAMVLLLLNFSWYYIGPSPSKESISALQFGAKLHEMTMISSITTAFMSYMRYELLSERGLPFGATFASFRVTELTYLWSRELWGSITSSSYNWKFKMRLGLAILFTTLLIATVGPASAACMAPRQAQWFVGDAFLGVNATKDMMFPINLTADLYKSDKCLGDSVDKYWWNSCLWTHSPATRYILLSLQPVFNNLLLDMGSGYNSNVSRVVERWTNFLSGLSLTLSLEHDISRLGVSSAAVSIQAQSLLYMIQVQNAFYGPRDVTSSDTENSYVTIGNTGRGYMDAYSRIQCFTANKVLWNILEPEPPLNFSITTTESNITEYLTMAERSLISDNVARSNGTYYEKFFLDIPRPNKSGIIYLESAIDEPGIGNFQHLWITPCTLEIGWFPTQLIFDGTTLSSSSGAPEQGSTAIHYVQAHRDWLATTNPFIVDVNTTAYKSMLGGFSKKLSNIVTAILVATTLSMMSPPSFYFGVEAGDQYVAWNSSSATSFTSCDESPCSKFIENFTSQYSSSYYREGYGYGPNVLAVKVSLAILVIYCIVAITHVVYSISTSISSTAWDSISEIVALCLNSRPASELQNTCAGIQTSRVFEHRVRIASTTGVIGSQSNTSYKPAGQHLELLFPSQEAHAIATVEVNAKYGTLKQKLD